MQFAALYLLSLVIFLALDAVMLRLVIAPAFREHLGDWLLDSPRFGPALMFYAFYVAGLTWLVSLPALRDGAPVQALALGALVGAMAYGTYEFTNLATLSRWSWSMVATDLAWGTVLTGVAAGGAVWLTRALGGAA